MIYNFIEGRRSRRRLQDLLPADIGDLQGYFLLDNEDFDKDLRREKPLENLLEELLYQSPWGPPYKGLYFGSPGG